MLKYCTNKNCSLYKKQIDIESDRCTVCGGPLQYSQNGTSLLNGDANAISELHNTSDSYNTSIDNTSNTNIDNSSNTNMHDSHDMHNSGTVNYVINNIQRAEGEMSLSERKAAYRETCMSLMKNGHIVPATREELDKRAVCLNLERNIARDIELNVQKNLLRASDSLNRGDRMTLDIVINQIKNNSGDIKESIPKLEALSDIDIDEVQFYVNMVCAFENPGAFIKKYENRNTDNYWQMFWAYSAYRKNGLINKAESLLRELENWHDYAADNVMLLHIAGWLYPVNNIIKENNLILAKDNLKSCGTISQLLRPFYNCINYMTRSGSRPVRTSNSAECNYYLKGFFGIEEEPAHTAMPSYSTKVIEASDIMQAAASMQQTRTSSVPQHSVKSDYTKYIVAGAIILVLIFAASNMFKREKEQPAPIAEQNIQPAQASNPATQQPAAKTAETAKAASAQTQTSNSTKQQTSAKPAEKAKAAPVQTQATSSAQQPVQQPAAAPIATAELSASELLSKGLSCVKKFQADQALSYFRQAAEKGSPEANYYIGDLYYNGNGVNKSFPTAKSYFEKAANSGVADAQYMLGVMYRNGQGVDKDISTAINWLQKAAAQGHTRAQQMLK